MALHRQTHEAPMLIGANAHTTDATISTATVLTTPAGMNTLMIQPFTNNIRYTLDGTTPTASLGFQLAAGVILTLDVSADMVITVIEEAASASIQYQWGSKS
ncbi:MAG TPA: hypothetical protein VLA24_17865 [Pseudomonadales bacterium]|nr:hypothetical protein [Pseudomonadales bacterium]